MGLSFFIGNMEMIIFSLKSHQTTDIAWEVPSPMQCLKHRVGCSISRSIIIVLVWLGFAQAD